MVGAPMNVMAQLLAVEPLPRGERLARAHETRCWAEPEPGDSVYRERPDPLWYLLLERGNFVGPLDQVFIFLTAAESAALWREYAAPLRRAREERKRLRAENARLRAALEERGKSVTRLPSSSGNYTAYSVKVRMDDGGGHAPGCAVFDGLLDYCACRPGRWSPGRDHADDCPRGQAKAAAKTTCDCGWDRVKP